MEKQKQKEGNKKRTETHKIVNTNNKHTARNYLSNGEGSRRKFRTDKEDMASQLTDNNMITSNQPLENTQTALANQ